MTELTLTKTRLFEGVWEGILRNSGESNTLPKIKVTHLEQPLEGVEVHENQDQAHWVLRIPIPAKMIADGVHTFLIQDAATGETLDSISIIAGEALGDDIRAETDLLRAELDMLKRAFRCHCLETL